MWEPAVPFDPIEHAREQLIPRLAAIRLSVEDEGQSDQAAFFGQILTRMEAAREPLDLAEPFMDLSMSAFMGFRFSAPVEMLLDQLLMHASQLSEVLSLDDDEVH